MFVLTAVLVFVDVVSVETVGNSDLTGVSEVRVCVPVVIMSESARSRMAARGWVTRASRKLDELSNVRDIDNLELRDAIEELDKRLETLDNAQSVVELELTVEQLEEDIIVASEFRDKARVPRMRATKMMAARVPARAPSEQDSVSVVSAAVEAKLPKLELPTFSGDVTEWTSFWDQFQAVVHASELPDITKFSYLRSLLKGEANAAVQGLSLTAAHYRIACDLLRDRFGRPERIVFSHIQELLNITVPKYPNVSVLWKLYDDLQAHIRSLAAMGITGEQYGVVLTPLILSRLPPDLRMEWAREGEQHESDLTFLLDFLHREVGRRERSQTFSKDSSAAPGDKTLMEKRGAPRVPTAAALHASVDSVSASQCAACGRDGHPLSRCYDITRAPVGDRKPILRGIGACYKCLSTDKEHVYRSCFARCAKCKGRHHVLLCDPSSRGKQSQFSTSCNTAGDSVHVNNNNVTSGSVNGTHDSVVSNVNSVTGVKTRVLLQTVRVMVQGRAGVSNAVILFDTGSDRTYISETLVRKIGPEWVGTHDLSYAAFGSGKPSRTELRNVYNVSLQGPTGNTENVVATEIPVICAPMYRPAVPQSVLASLGQGVEFVDLCEGQEIQVDILVGLDAYWRLMTSQMIGLPGGLMAQRSVFGWVMSGHLPETSPTSDHVHVSFQLLCMDVSESSLRNFWDLESVGICSDDSREVDPVLAELQEKVSFSEGRYMATLPWKSKAVRPKLLNNEKLARSRLSHVTGRLSKAPAGLGMASRCL